MHTILNSVHYLQITMWLVTACLQLKVASLIGLKTILKHFITWFIYISPYYTLLFTNYYVIIMMVTACLQLRMAWWIEAWLKRHSMPSTENGLMNWSMAERPQHAFNWEWPDELKHGWNVSWHDSLKHAIFTSGVCDDIFTTCPVLWMTWLIKAYPSELCTAQKYALKSALFGF